MEIIKYFNSLRTAKLARGWQSFFVSRGVARKKRIGNHNDR